MTEEAKTRPASDELCFSIRRKASIFSRVYITVNAVVALVIFVAILASAQFPLVKRLGVAAIWMLLLVPLFVWLKRRLLDSTVKATPEGLRIYNGMRRHFVRWDDVAGFEPSFRPFLFAVRRVSGGSVTMDGITPETFGQRGPQEDQVRELEAYWHRVAG
jgi:hypothetical protein